MKCPNCNQEATGNFCNHCGFPLPLEPDLTEDHDIDPTNDKTNSPENNKSKSKQVHRTTEQQTKVKKKKKKKGRIKNVVSSGVSTASSITTGSVNATWKLIMMVLQWICAALMLLGTWKLFLGCWAQRTALGSIMGVVSEKNVNQAAYLILSVSIIAFGIIQTLWIIGRKKMPDNGKTRRIDTGRGIFGFAVMVILAVAAHYLYPLIPEHPYPLPGLRQFLGVVTGLGKSFFLINVAGFVFSIIRKA